jgi:hypothetical protein
MDDTDVKYARVILVAREAGQPIDIEVHALATAKLSQTAPCVMAYGADGRPNEVCPTGEYTLSLELTWTNPESRKRFEEFAAKHGSENVELCDPKLPRTQDKVDLHLAAPLG